jgi:hypothetical protein
MIAWRAARGKPVPVAQAPVPGAVRERGTVSLPTRLTWLAYAFIPSSLMLAVTTYISTDISPVPLLWVVPLGLYLLTFVVAFGHPPSWVRPVAAGIMPVLVLILVAFMCSKAAETGLKALFESTRLVIPLHLAAFTLVAMVFHGELAARRPEASRLTEFYLWVSVGGVAGGAFNAIVAPALFSSMAEYSITLTLAGVLMPSWGSHGAFAWMRRAWARRPDWVPRFWGPSPPAAAPQPTQPRRGLAPALDVLLPAAVGLLAAVLVHRGSGLNPLVQYGVPALLCCAFLTRPIRFGLSVGAILLVSGLYVQPGFHVVYRERNFFGTIRVLADEKDESRWFYHGTTQHGGQWRFSPAARRIPRLYFYPNSPIGQVFAAFKDTPKKKHVAVCGLGAGTLACYCEPGEEFTFFEIDRAVERVARGYFTYLEDCRGDCRVVLGDARLAMRDELDHSFGIIVLDAFSSDALPVHLLTREAIALYLSKLTPDGVIAVNISNKYLDLEPVVHGVAAANGLVSRVQYDVALDPADIRQGKYGSIWMVLARDPQHLGPLRNNPRWLPEGTPGRIVWSDDYSNIAGLIRWW